MFDCRSQKVVGRQRHSTTRSFLTLTIVGLLLLLSILPRASLAYCDERTLDVRGQIEDCGSVTADGATCILPSERCVTSGDMVVRSFTCDGSSWVWSSPPVFCERFASICRWDEGKNILDCDYSSAPVVATYGAFRSLDPRLEDVRIVNFPQLTFTRNTFAGLEASLVRLNLSGNANANYFESTLAGLSLLNSLDLSGNDLTQLGLYSLPPFGRLVYLDLRNNSRLKDKPLALFTLHAAVETCRSLHTTSTRTLLVDDDFCTLEDHRGVQPNTVCTLLVCKNRTDHQVACPPSSHTEVQNNVGHNTTYVSPSQLCNGIEDCPSASDESAAICETRMLSVFMSDPGARPECFALQTMFGNTLQMRSGLVIMTLEKRNTYLYNSIPVLVWNRPSVMAGELQYVMSSRATSDLSSISSQLILAPENVIIVFNLTSDNDEIPFTELNCRYDAPYEIAATTTEALSTSLVTSSTTAALPKEGPPSSTSETAAAASVGAAVAAFLIILFINHRTRRRHASALDQLAPPVPHYIISQAQESYLLQYANVVDRTIAPDVYSKLLLRIDQIKISQVCLGGGVSGQVFLGHISTNTASSDAAKLNIEYAEGIRVAVKVFGHISPHAVTDESTSRLRSALLEARLHARLSHPNVVRLLGVQEARQPVMLALEFCEHGALRDLLRTTAGQRSFNLIQRQGMAAQVAAGLRYLHGKLCVHRDVAARNVLVASGGDSPPPCGYTVKLGDLGLARQLRPASDYYTSRGDDAVPIRWQCPEAVTTRVYTAKSDVYSFGVLLFEIYSDGAKPYGHLAAGDVVRAVQAGEILARPQADTPDDVVRLMRLCTSLAVSARPTMATIHGQLAGAWVGVGSMPSTPSAPGGSNQVDDTEAATNLHVAYQDLADSTENGPDETSL